MGEDKTLVRITAEQLETIPYHLKTNLRILLVLEGTIQASWVSGTQILREGDVEIINVSEPVKLDSVMENNLVLFFEIDRDFAKQYCEAITRCTFNCSCAFFFSSKADERMQYQFKRQLMKLYELYREAARSGEPLSPILGPCLRELIEFVSVHFNDVGNMFADLPNQEVHRERFLRINDFLIENLDRKICLKDIADIEYLSLQYLSKEFNDRLKRNFHTILDYYRIIRAVRLLISTEIPVSGISAQCGFSAPRYFYRQFRKFMNCTPSEFRSNSCSRPAFKKKVSLEAEEVVSALERFRRQWERQESQGSSLMGGGIGAEVRIEIDLRRPRGNWKGFRYFQMERKKSLAGFREEAIFLAQQFLEGQDISDFLKVFDPFESVRIMVAMIDELGETIHWKGTDFAAAVGDDGTLRVLLVYCPNGEPGGAAAKRVALSVIGEEFHRLVRRKIGPLGYGETREWNAPGAVTRIELKAFSAELFVFSKETS